MSNISEAVAQSEIPDGFSFADPTGSASPSGGGRGGGGGSADAAAQREAQRQAILEQAMTPDALARLRRVKVRGSFVVADVMMLGAMYLPSFAYVEFDPMVRHKIQLCACTFYSFDLT